MDDRKFYTGKYDRVFKTILCDQDNPKMLSEFLSRLLDKKVEVIEFLRNELPVNTTLEKSKILDVLVKADNDYIHIELNISDPDYLHQRTVIQFCGLYTKKTQKNEDYIIKEKFFVYNLVYGIKKERKTNNIEEVYYLMNKDGVKYIDNIEFHEVDMDKVMDIWYSKDEKKLAKYKHLIMLDLETKDLKELSKGDDLVEEFEEKVTSLNEDETFWNIMTREEDERRIRNSERKLGIEQGALEANIKNAKAMLEDKVDMQLISKYTGLSIEEIEKLYN